jgi:hypothetical protein
MKIDLMAMAQKAEETYLDVECSFGNVRVYHIPDAVLLSASIGRPEPELPMIAMRTATGVQERPSKKGDKEYDGWLIEKAEYDNELFQLRNATATVPNLLKLSIMGNGLRTKYCARKYGLILPFFLAVMTRVKFLKH